MIEHPNSALLTDLYQLTMLQSYHDRGMDEPAVFEFFVRSLPTSRSFLLAAGLEQVLDYLGGLRFQPDELDWLRHTGRFGDAFVDYLAALRFTGDVHALPEGTVFFANEPVLRVTAPLPEAQLVETRVINLLQIQTMVASKAARCVLAAPGRTLVDFGLRRAHGAEAGLGAARASYLAGFAGSATVLAGRLWEVPIFGTMAHSLVQAHDSETQAFEDFSRSQPGNVVLLIDTYDTEEGARRVVELAPRLARDGISIKAVRIDSGDLAGVAHRVRRILDMGGLREVGIFSSGNLDEYRLAALLKADAPIEGFGIGTRLDTCEDAPSLDCVYKLQEYAGRARRKRSAGKATWPGRKQVYRHYDAEGRMCHDVVTLAGCEEAGEPLLEKVMARGRRVGPAPRLDALRRRAAAELERLPARLRTLGADHSYPVTIARALWRLAAEVDRVAH